MAKGPQVLAKRAHGQEKSGHFLHMVGDVVGFLANLHQGVGNVGLDSLEPAVLVIELVTQY